MEDETHLVKEISEGQVRVVTCGSSRNKASECTINFNFLNLILITINLMRSTESPLKMVFFRRI